MSPADRRDTELVASMLENMPGGVAVYKNDGRSSIVYTNQYLRALLGCNTNDELMALSDGCFLNLVLDDDKDAIGDVVRLESMHGANDLGRITYRIKVRGGGSRQVDTFGRFAVDPKYGGVFVVFIVPSDAKSMPYVSDRLTGLPGMGEFLEYAHSLDVVEGQHLSIVYFNVCDFKMFNVRNGSQSGNAVLREVARLLRTHFSTGFIARFADDHFVVLTSDEDPCACVNDVHDAFAVAYSHEGMELKAGVYDMDGGADLSIACDYAKIACDSIRHVLDQHCCIYTEGMGHRSEVADYVVHKLDEALEKGWIKTYYQPVVRTMSRALCGMEALSRWDDPELGMLSPGVFIQALEDSRQITKLDVYTVRQVCRQIRECLDAGEDIVPISFNLSRLDLIDRDMFAEIESIADEYDIPRDMLNVEMTESMMVRDSNLVMDKLRKFQDRGYQVWMDDFGSGYSSLNLLKDYNFDEIKIDMAFLTHFTDRARGVIRSVVDMAKRIGIQTLAEGVEIEEQFDFLRSIGCEKVQGYYFCRPLPFDQALEHCRMQGLSVEQGAWRAYFDRIGTVNLITDNPLALLEYDGHVFDFMFCNSLYWEALVKSGASGMEEVYETMNSSSSENAVLYRELLPMIPSDGSMQDFDYIVRGRMVNARIRFVAECQGKSIYQVEIVNVT